MLIIYKILKYVSKYVSEGTRQSPVTKPWCKHHGIVSSRPEKRFLVWIEKLKISALSLPCFSSGEMGKKQTRDLIKQKSGRSRLSSIISAVSTYNLKINNQVICRSCVIFLLFHESVLC